MGVALQCYRLLLPEYPSENKPAAQAAGTEPQTLPDATPQQAIFTPSVK